MQIFQNKSITINIKSKSEMHRVCLHAENRLQEISVHEIIPVSLTFEDMKDYHET